MDKLAPRQNGSSHRALISFVSDRPGHDFRYAMDFSRLSAELGWRPQEYSFESGLAFTVKWYLDNRAWWEPMVRAGDATHRRGLPKEDS